MKHAFALLALSLLPLSGQSEMLLNNNFAEGMKYWNINRLRDYGSETTAVLTKGELHLGQLRSLSMGYLNLTQAVSIEKGKRYRFTFEVQGTPGKQVGFSIGDHQARETSSNVIKLVGTDWEAQELEFTAKCSSDSSWFTKKQKIDRRNKLTKDGITTSDPKAMRNLEVKSDDGIGACVVAVGLGLVEGNIAFRNFSLTEISE